MDFQLADWVPK